MPNWNEVFIEIQTLQAQAINAQNVVRHKYLQALHKHTGRNIISYYSGWFSKGNINLSEINDEDKNGFMTTIHKLDRNMGLDLILHTPGGGIAATQSLVNYIQKMFGRNIRAIVPQLAMSAGCIMACCCKEIWMGKQSNLGPIDPHLRGIPAYGVVAEFKRAIAEIRDDPRLISVWQHIIGQYRPTFLGQCENAIAWSNEFVEQQLAEGMFAGDHNAKKKAKKTTRALSDYAKNKSHERHFDADECEKVGLNIKHLESDPTMQDLVLTIHHCYMNLLMNSPAFKIIENQNGTALVKNTQVAISPAPGQRAEQSI
jgi:membrane-bound ClpP family serine protease